MGEKQTLFCVCYVVFFFFKCIPKVKALKAYVLASCFFSGSGKVQVLDGSRRDADSAHWTEPSTILNKPDSCRSAQDRFNDSLVLYTEAFV